MFKYKYITTAIALSASFAVQANAADFGTEVDRLDQSAEAENVLGVAIDDSTVFAGVNYACGVKANRVDQTVSAKNVLAIAISDSQAAVASNVIGDDRCLK